MPVTSSTLPSVTITTSPARPAAASSAGPSRLAPAAGGAVSNGATPVPNRQITAPPRRLAIARAVSSAARHGAPLILRDASSSTIG